MIEKVFLLFLWLVFIAYLYRKQKPVYALAGLIIFSSVYVILYMIPLGRAYSLDLNRDRLYNMSHAMSIAAGNSIQENQMYSGVPNMYGPFFPILIAIIYLMSKVNMQIIYTYSPILITIFLPLSIYIFWVRALSEYSVMQRSQNIKEEYKWESALIIFLVLFLTTDLDIFKSHFSNGFWQMLLLLKPNHAVALVFVPLIIYLTSKQGKISSIGAGIILGMVHLSNIFFGMIVLFSLFIYSFIWSVCKKEKLSGSLINSAIIGAISLITTAWYWKGPLLYYLPLGKDEAAFELPIFIQSMKTLIFDPFESTVLLGHLFWLGLLGIVVAIKRGSKADYILVSLIFSSYIIKLITPFTYIWLNIAPEPDDLSFFIRFVMAFSSGTGLCWLLKKIAMNSGRLIEYIEKHELFILMKKILSFIPSSFTKLRLEDVGKVPALVVLTFSLATPLLPPFWFFPNIMDYRWVKSLQPIDNSIVGYTNWIKKNTKGSDTIIASPDASQWIASLSGRKVVIAGDGRDLKKKDYVERYNSMKKFLTGQNAEEKCGAITRLKGKYLLIDSDIQKKYSFDFAPSNELLSMRYSDGDIKIFELKKGYCSKTI